MTRSCRYTYLRLDGLEVDGPYAACPELLIGDPAVPGAGVSPCGHGAEVWLTVSGGIVPEVGNGVASMQFHGSHIVRKGRLDIIIEASEI
jgi:hypothetical protein